jgi:ppGpp synthetase/RelA/SpoT-type nucleotidyltranferase
MSSSGKSSSWDQDILVDYKQKRPQYEKLVKLTREKCEDLLTNISIKGVVQGRAKKPDSLETKLKDPGFEKWVSENQKSYKHPIYEHPDMMDLAGVRIGLFFPEDILTVEEEILKHFNKMHTFGTVTDERTAPRDKNEDIEKHDIPPWVDSVGDHWEHYGYKSWQIVVTWKEPPDGVEDLIKPLRVEIQVGTVVSQAWAEVQHNIIYKKPPNVRATPTMKRMIDAINGMAITTEIMLRELRRGLMKVEEDGQNRCTVLSTILGTSALMYMPEMLRQSRNDWVDSWHEAENLLNQMQQANAAAHPGPRPWISDTDFETLDKKLNTLGDEGVKITKDIVARTETEMLLELTPILPPPDL